MSACRMIEAYIREMIQEFYTEYHGKLPPMSVYIVLSNGREVEGDFVEYNASGGYMTVSAFAMKLRILDRDISVIAFKRKSNA